jgi:hypothetical protein
MKNNQELTLTYPEWDRQKGESPKAFEAFVKYRDMGYTRSIRAVGLVLRNGQNPDTLYAHLYRLAQQWKWKERTALYLQHLDQISREELEFAVREMGKRHAKHSKLIFDALLVPIYEFARKNNLIAENRKSGNKDKTLLNQDLDKLSMADLFHLVRYSASLAPSIADMERKAYGESTEINKLDITSGGDKIKPDLQIVVNGSRSPLLEKLLNANDEEESS